MSDQDVLRLVVREAKMALELGFGVPVMAVALPAVVTGSEDRGAPWEE